MTGSVVRRQALLSIPFRLAGQPDMSIEFVIDTGFTDYLTLPRAAVAAMALPFLYRMNADPADDSSIEIDVHLATVLWDGVEKNVRVLATGRRPLLGTALLDGCDLAARFVEGGQVTVKG